MKNEFENGEANMGTRTNDRAPRRRPANPATEPMLDAPDDTLRAANFSDGQPTGDNHTSAAVAGDDRAQKARDNQTASSPVIAEIIQLTRLWSRWLKAKNKLILQGKAMCRQWTEGDKGEANKLYEAAREGAVNDPHIAFALVPFLAATDFFEVEIEKVEKTLTKLGQSLPVWSSWAKDVKGFSALGLAKIIGSANDEPGNFRNPSCLWKRMGLAVMDGHRQGNPGTGATAEEWTVEAYSSSRRSIVWNIGNSLIGGMGKFRPLFDENVAANAAYSPYQKLFAKRCRLEAERLPHKDGTAIKQSETGKESYTLHAANRAKRYVEKRLLRDLWQQWRRASLKASESTSKLTPAADTLRREATSGLPEKANVMTLPGEPTERGGHPTAAERPTAWRRPAQPKSPRGQKADAAESSHVPDASR